MSRRSAYHLPLALVLTSCGPLPPATPPETELAALSERVARSRADSRSAIRLGAGMWANRRHAEARALLEDVRQAAPEVPEYTAALGVMAEGWGDYGLARDLYLDFITRSPSSALSGLLAERVESMRAQTARYVVRRLIDEGGTLDHDGVAGSVTAIPRIEAPADDPELARVAAAETELLISDLRGRGVLVLDWEIAQAAKDVIVEESGASRPQAVAALLDARRVLQGQVTRSSGDSISFRLDVLRIDPGGNTSLSRDSVRVPEAYGEERLPLVDRAWEMLIGSRAGSAPTGFFESPTEVSTHSTLLALGDGLTAVWTGDLTAARGHFEVAERATPGFAPVTRRLTDLDRLQAFERSATLPLAEDLLRYARQREATAFQLSVAGASTYDLSSTRHGVGEILGLDRLGSQVFIDLLIRTRPAGR